MWEGVSAAGSVAAREGVWLRGKQFGSGWLRIYDAGDWHRES